MSRKKTSTKKRTEWLQDIAKIGGKNGVGESKRRPPEHYQKMLAARKLKISTAMIEATRERWKNKAASKPPLTLARLAKELGVSIAHVSLIVNNKRRNSI